MGREYEIQRYRYGQVVKYTAFALVPWQEPTERTLPSGETIVTGNGPKNPGALHFRTIGLLLRYGKANGLKVRNLDDTKQWELLPGTRLPLSKAS